ncbi:MAG: TIR domain-containing protein [Lacunisphaera sp.]|nr:TIR domain-containing protein [Lacunisphaera sp.]
MSDATKAVFLSYAREDAAAAKRIAEALRAFGVEVWFDQSELRGGDSWDQKIRTQIKTCALFMPIVSGRTEERTEGYFRREWKLAVDRTHDMAGGRSFIVPIVIDDTSEATAAVPEEFMRFQWTRLPAGEATPEFVSQVKRLLEAPKKPSLKADQPRPPTLPPMLRQAAPVAGVDNPGPASARPATVKPGVSGWIWGAAVAAVFGGVAVFFALRKPEPAAPSPAASPKPQASDLARPPAADAKSIAVLPFANLSTDKENEFFADGVQDDVITNLAKIRDLTVISRTSTLAYRDAASRNLKKIAAELNVATILEGSVRRVGSKVHMNAQLIDARTDAHLWADTFDGDTGDIFALQASLAQKIAAALKATLTPGERTLIERRPTEIAAAYDLFVRARTLQQELGESGSVPDYEKLVELYQQAIALDPSFALAQAQVATVHSVMYWFGNLDPSPGRAEKMKTAVNAAVRIAPDAPETHLARGALLYRVHGDWLGALAEFQAAEAGLPNDAQLGFWLAVTHRRLGHWSVAIDYFHRAVTLNPRDFSAVGNYTGFLFDLHRWQQARDESLKFLRYFPLARDLRGTSDSAEFALQGDRAAYARSLEAMPADVALGRSLDQFQAAMIRGELTAAEQVLAGLTATVLVDPATSSIKIPITYLRAHLAWAKGDRGAAARWADEAIYYFSQMKPNARQAPWVKIRLAAARALAGRTAEGVAEARAALATMLARDRYDGASVREAFGVVLIIAGQRDEAIACLSEMMKEPGAFSPNSLRIDPFWSRLKDDPRFEEILQSAKPL